MPVFNPTRLVLGTSNEISVSSTDVQSTVSLPSTIVLTGKSVTAGTFTSPTVITPAITTSAVLTGSDSGVFPTLNTASRLTLVNTSGVFLSGGQIQFGLTSGAPFAVIGSALIDGSSPVVGQLRIAVRDADTGTLTTSAVFDTRSVLLMGDLSQAPGGRQNFAAVNQFGYQAVYGVSKTSGLVGPSTNLQSTAGGYFIGINDNTDLDVVNPASYGVYAEGQIRNLGGGVGAEIDCQNLSGSDARLITPNDMFGASSSGPWCPAIWSAVGGSSPDPMLDSSALLGVHWGGVSAGEVRYKKGIVFSAQSLRALGGHTEVFNCPADYEFVWYHSNNVSLGRLSSDGTGLIFQNASTGNIILYPPIGLSASISFGSSSGTPAVTASSPLAINTSTGNISITGAALTKTDDTNVTLTLGGSASSSLVNAASITVGWTGTLAASRGGTGISSLGTGVATALGVNVGSAGAFVVNGGALGTPSSGTLTNATGLPISGITGLGTGVGTALAVNIGSAGAPILFNGAGGTPSSLTLTNATGLPTTGLTGTLQAAQEPAHTGDVTNSAGSLALTLATVNSNVGTFGSATKASVITVNAKGLVTAASESTVTPAIGSVTGLGTGVATALAVNTGTDGAFVVKAGALGTPSSGTLTNCTGLPVSGITASTSTALGVGSVEIGHATDTTISRVSAGVIAVEGVNVLMNGGALGSPSSVGTLPAHTLGGTISGGGNQINNVVIGATTPLAATFTKVTTAAASSNCWDYDATGNTLLTIANGSHASIGAGSGLIQAHNTTDNECALYYMNFGTGVMLANPNGGDWVSPTTTPTAGHQSIAYDGSTYSIYNNTGGSRDYCVSGWRILNIA